jgi:hypothetical protein
MSFLPVGGRVPSTLAAVRYVDNGVGARVMEAIGATEL